MRADRLVAVLLMLQRRGQVTAAEVADELEVSERTARRDLDALGMAGIPVYAVRGRGGGWRLAGGGRIDLSGLTEAEVRALFLLVGPQAGDTETKAAVRKLVRALPEPLRESAEQVSDRVVIDPSTWDHPRDAGAPAPAHLNVVQRAVMENHRLRLGYEARDGRVTRRVVDPLGVVAKDGTWYLFAQTDQGPRSFRVDRITDVTPTGEVAPRPEAFDLAETWRHFVAEVDRMRTPLVARAYARPEMVGVLHTILGGRVSVGAARADGWVQVELRGHTVRSLAGEIAGFGATLDVVGPPELRSMLASVGAELVAAYDEPPADDQ